MAESSTAAKRAGATRKKLALIGVLSVVLVGVLYIQFGRSEDSSELTPAEASPRRAAAAANAANSSTTTTATAAGAMAKGGPPAAQPKEFLLEPIDRPHWKTPELAQVVRYDPFALPAAFPQPHAAGTAAANAPEGGMVAAADVESAEDAQAKVMAEAQTKLADLKQRGVHVIITGVKAAAIVGDRTIHVGDEIEGFTVKAIDHDGVVVERTLD